MSTALELIRVVEGAGGRFKVDGNRLGIVPASAVQPVMGELRQHKAEIIDLLRSRATPPMEAPMDAGWGDWLLDNCVFRDCWFGGVGALHLDLARWCADHRQPVPTSRRAFVEALQAEGFQVTGDGLVYGLILKTDQEAYERFQTPPVAVETSVPARRARRPM